MNPNYIFISRETATIMLKVYQDKRQGLVAELQKTQYFINHLEEALSLPKIVVEEILTPNDTNTTT